MSRIIVILFFLFANVAVAQDTHTAIRKGNTHYKKGEFDQSIPEYKRAVEIDPKNPVANYNYGNALFRNNNFDESVKAFENSINSTEDKVYKERAYYNKGVSYSKQKKIHESVDAYKSALKIDPNDADARHNLQKALYELKKQNENQQKQNKEEQNEDKKEKQKEKPKQQQSKLNKKQVENLLKALQQKEQEVQKKIQQSKSRSSGQQEKDW